MRELLAMTGAAGLVLVLATTMVTAGTPGPMLHDAAGGKAAYLEIDADHPRIEYPDGLVSLNDRCPPCGRKISLGMPPVYVNGRPIGFCCKPCPPRFFEEPGAELSALGIHVPCIMDPAVDAVLDGAHSSFVNREVFFFSTTVLKSQFDRAPHLWCGALTDPVSGERFRPSDTSPRVEYDGRPYYFASEDTWRTFDGEPGRYAAVVVEPARPADSQTAVRTF